MNIGIDIDNTLTEIQEELDKAALEYAMKIGKNISIVDLNKLKTR